jgi:hypothetical protein
MTVVLLFSPFIETAFAEISLSWTAPTTNTDRTPLTVGTALNDLAGFMIYYCAGSSCSPEIWLYDVGYVTAYKFSMIKGAYCFAVTAYNNYYIQSSYSNVVCRTENDDDNSAPIITAFSIPSESSSLIVPITSFAATDNVGVTGYMVSESPVTPSAASDGWQDIPPTYYIFTSAGSKTLYAWVRDASGNISAGVSASVYIVTAVMPTTVTLTPDNDTFINIDDSINSSSETLNTYTWPYEKVANSILMKFDLSGIPSGSVIKDATLYLYLEDADTNASYPAYNLSLNRIVNLNPDISVATGLTADGQNSWTPNECCYNNIPLAQADISDAYETKAIDKTSGFKSFNATQLVADWIASPSTNYGLMINSDITKPADTYRTFASSKRSNTARHPYLSITYYAVSPENCDKTIFRIGVGALYYYSSIQDAYNGLDSGDTLDMRAGAFGGNLYINQSKSVTLAGGYRCDFSSNTGYTVIDGALTINDGSVTIENLIIK